jgi:hypothetical protein
MATIAILALLTLWILVFSRRGRRAESPVDSVERQQRALGALHSVAERARGSRSGGGRPEPRYVRAPPRDRSAALEEVHLVVPPRPAPVAPRRRRRVVTVGVAVAASVAALLVGLGPWGLGVWNPGSRAGRSASTQVPRGGTTRRAAPTAGTEATTTTIASTLRPTASNDTQAVFTVPLDGFRITVIASGPCWLQVRATGSGAVLSEGTLAAGDTRTFDASSSLWLRLGDSDNVAVVAADRRVDFPGRPGTPYNLSFIGPSGAP